MSVVTNVVPVQRAWDLIAQAVVLIRGDQLEAHRERLCRTLPIRRVVSPADIAASAIHLMMNSVLIGATFGVDRANNSSSAAPRVLPARLAVE